MYWKISGVAHHQTIVNKLQRVGQFKTPQINRKTLSYVGANKPILLDIDYMLSAPAFPEKVDQIGHVWWRHNACHPQGFSIGWFQTASPALLARQSVQARAFANFTLANSAEGHRFNSRLHPTGASISLDRWGDTSCCTMSFPHWYHGECSS